MKNFLFAIALLSLVACDNTKIAKTESKKPELATSLKQAVLNRYFTFNEDDIAKLSGFDYYKYINLQNVIGSLSLTDSIKIENLWLIMFKYSINGHDYNQAEWFITIKGNYFYAGVWVSKYNVEEIFDRENIDLVKALIDKADAWEAKSEKRWWKYVD